MLLELADAEPATGNDGPALRPSGPRGPARRRYPADRLAPCAAAGRATPGAPAPAEPERTARLTRPFEWFLRGGDLCKEGRLEEAITFFDNALAARPDYFGAHYRAGGLLPEAQRAAGRTRARLTCCWRGNISRFASRKNRTAFGPICTAPWPRASLRDFDAAEADFTQAGASSAKTPLTIPRCTPFS